MLESPPPSWKELALAKDVNEVLAVARDFQRLEPWQVSESPPNCTPRQLRTSAELSAYACEFKRSTLSLKGTAAGEAQHLA